MGRANARVAVTLEGVAAHAGVSRQTVSNAINAPGKLHPATLRRVQESIAVLGYRPNRYARSLRTRSTGVLGFALPLRGDLGLGGYLERFLTALSAAAQSSGRQLLLFHAPPGGDGLAVYDDLVAQGAVDAFVLAGVRDRDPLPELLTDRGVSFVAVGRGAAGESWPWVDVDREAGIGAVVRHLHGLGHRRIAALAGPPARDDGLAGWQQACLRLGLPGGSHLVARGDPSVHGGRRAAWALLTSTLAPTALVALTDELAIGALRAVADLPADLAAGIAVTGFGDSPAAAVMNPALTSVQVPVEDCARDVVRLLDGANLLEPAAAAWRLRQPSLVIRASSVPPAAG